MAAWEVHVSLAPKHMEFNHHVQNSFWQGYWDALSNRSHQIARLESKPIPVATDANNPNTMEPMAPACQVYQDPGQLAKGNAIPTGSSRRRTKTFGESKQWCHRLATKHTPSDWKETSSIFKNKEQKGRHVYCTRAQVPHATLKYKPEKTICNSKIKAGCSLD